MADYLSDLGRHNPPAARKIVSRFRALRHKLADFPNMAQRGTLEDTRRLVMRPFILTVRMNGGIVEIIAVRHERQADPGRLRDLETDN